MLLRLLEPYLTAEAPGLLVGPGDDAAVWQPRPGHAVVVTTDSLVEDVHFHLAPGDSAYNTDLGWKLLAVSLSDLAAMGAEPGPAFVSLSLPPAWRVEWVEAMYRGLADCALCMVAALPAATSAAPPPPSLPAPASVKSTRGTCSGVPGRDRGGSWRSPVSWVELPPPFAPPEATRADGAGAATRMAAVDSPAAAAPQPGCAQRRRGGGGRYRLPRRKRWPLYRRGAHSWRRAGGWCWTPRCCPAEPGLREAFPDGWLEVVGGGEDYELLFAGPPRIVAEACRRLRRGGLRGPDLHRRVSTAPPACACAVPTATRSRRRRSATSTSAADANRDRVGFGARRPRAPGPAG